MHPRARAPKHTHTPTHTHTHTPHTVTPTHTHARTRAHTHKHTQTHTSTHALTHARAHTHTHTHTHAQFCRSTICMRAYVRAYVRACVRTYERACARISPTHVVFVFLKRHVNTRLTPPRLPAGRPKNPSAVTCPEPGASRRRSRHGPARFTPVAGVSSANCHRFRRIVHTCRIYTCRARHPTNPPTHPACPVIQSLRSPTLLDGGQQPRPPSAPHLSPTPRGLLPPPARQPAASCSLGPGGSDLSAHTVPAAPRRHN